MLVVSRHEDESVNLHLPDGSVIQVMVVEIGHKAVRIGIEAARGVRILRDELEDRDARDVRDVRDDRRGHAPKRKHKAGEHDDHTRHTDPVHRPDAGD